MTFMPMINEMLTDGLARLRPIVESAAREAAATAAPEPDVPISRGRHALSRSSPPGRS
ncbi:MAG: hypothetical protein QOF49_1347 [Chloroflexota bacterium]|nr:hypothetical protein [Chloroflexota bacterium]